MQQHTTSSTSTKVACFVSLFAGLASAVYAFVARNPETGIVFAIAAILMGGLSDIKARKNIDDMQVATAGIFMAFVALAVSLWQIYN
jgi:hypothetical protein